MQIEIPAWTTHHNQFLYSFLIYSIEKKIDLKFSLNTSIHVNGAVLNWKGKKIYFDYCDDVVLIDNPENYDFYFKRSLLKESQEIYPNLFPLNFHVNFAKWPLKLISKMSHRILTKKESWVEVVRAIDVFGKITNESHLSVDLGQFSRTNPEIGRVIFMTRLWDPSRNDDPEEKERRMIQNDFRINACRILKKSFPDSFVGIFPDEFGVKSAPDILLEINHTLKRNYLSALAQSDIAIADDGLKDTPGWKIGEYLMAGKAVITTPIKVLIEDFEENVNFLSTGRRDDYAILPDLVNSLRKDQAYKLMQEQNKQWYKSHLEPVAYVSSILSKVDQI